MKSQYDYLHFVVLNENSQSMMFHMAKKGT